MLCGVGYAAGTRTKATQVARQQEEASKRHQKLVGVEATEHWRDVAPCLGFKLPHSLRQGRNFVLGPTNEANMHRERTGGSGTSASAFGRETWQP